MYPAIAAGMIVLGLALLSLVMVRFQRGRPVAG
jgi:hypothetical protein